MAGVTNHTYANNDRIVTGRQFGVGNGARTVWNLRGMDSDRALLHPVLYKIDWGGIQQLYSTARTNLYVQSQTLGTTWTQTNVTISADAIAAPDGTTTADRVVEAATTSTHFIRQNIAVSALPYTQSCYAKRGERDFVWLTMDGASNKTWFNLATGAVATKSGNHTATITDVGSGWYRCTITQTLGAGTANTFFGVTSADNTDTYLGDITKGIYVWGCQLSQASSVTSYIVTVAAAVTVTDYSTAATGVVTFATAPPVGTQITYKDPYAGNVYRHFGLGDGTNTGYSLPFVPVAPLIYRRSWAGNELLYATARTNLCLQSQTFGTTWDVASYPCSISANSTVAPDGTTTADTITATAGNARHGVQSGAITAAAGSVHTLSVYVKKGNYTNIVIGDSNDSVWHVSNFDLDAGTNIGDTNATGTITSIVGSPGWYRVTTTFTRTAVGQILFVIALQNTSNKTQVTGFNAAGTETLIAWEAQVESGSVATSKITTTTAAVTVTDYTVAPNGDVTLASAPVDLATLTWTGNMGPLR